MSHLGRRNECLNQMGESPLGWLLTTVKESSGFWKGGLSRPIESFTADCRPQLGVTQVDFFGWLPTTIGDSPSGFDRKKGYGWFPVLPFRLTEESRGATMIPPRCFSKTLMETHDDWSVGDILAESTWQSTSRQMIGGRTKKEGWGATLIPPGWSPRQIWKCPIKLKSWSGGGINAKPKGAYNNPMKIGNSDVFTIERGFFLRKWVGNAIKLQWPINLHQASKKEQWFKEAGS